jgi:hypothetical protein
MLSQRLRAACLLTGIAVLLAGCSLIEQEERVGVTFPEGWETSEVLATMYRDARRGAWLGVYPVFGDEVAAITVGWDPDAESACGVFSGPERGGRNFVDWARSWDVVAYTAAKPGRDPDRELRWSDPGSDDDVMLPSGPALLIGAQRSDRLSGMQYTVNGDGRSFVLACYANETPPDRWLSIAETIEFLPAEE